MTGPPPRPSQTPRPPQTAAAAAVAAVAALEPDALQDSLDREGFAVTAPLIDAPTCAQLARLYTAADTALSRYRDHGAARIRQR